MTYSVTKTSFAKRLLNRAKDLLFIKPLLPFWRKRLNGKAMIYLYHRLEEKGKYSFLDEGGSPMTSVDEYRQDIQMLKSWGASFVRFSDLALCDYTSGGFYVVICADDGFASNYQDGQMVADQEKIPQTIFQCSAMVETTELIWEHQLYYLFQHSDEFKTYLANKTKWPSSLNRIRDELSAEEIQKVIDVFLLSHQALKQKMQLLASEIYPSKEQLISASEAGHEVASHGDTHCNRMTISNEKFEQELQVSKDSLESIIQKPVNAFSYPFNKYKNDDDQRCAQSYSFVATVDGGAVDTSTALLSIPRNTYPGKAKNKLRQRRWLLTGSI